MQNPMENQMKQHEHQHKHSHENNEPNDKNHHNHHEMMIADFKKRFLASLVLMVPILLLSPILQTFLGVDWRFSGDTYILFALSTVLFFYCGKPFLTGAKEELDQKSPAMMMLITLAIIVAYVYSTLTVFVLDGDNFYWELATLIVIMLLGHWIEMQSVVGASKALETLAKLMPDEANLIKESGEIKVIPVNDLKAGQKVLVKPGEKIPIDGIIYEVSSDVNEAMITGESTPVSKSIDDQVVGGAMNGEGLLKFKVNRTGDETFLSKVIEMVREAQDSKSNTQRLADTAAKWLFYLALSAGIITFTVWLFASGDINFALQRTVTVMVIACPHALGLATPLVTSRSISIGAEHGLLIRNRAAFEAARKINTIIFDKTGTLTQGAFGVTDIYSEFLDEDELLKRAYAIEMNSEHPIAKGIVKAGKEKNLPILDISDYENMAGKGLRAKIHGKTTQIVSPGFMTSHGINFDHDAYDKLASQGKTVVFVLEEQNYLGYIALSDIVRESAKNAIAALDKMAIKSMLLTGDNQRVANYVGQQVGVSEVIAEALPNEKASHVKSKQDNKTHVAMTGDGVNDAPSLATADLGIAIGAGTDVAIETADVILVKSDPMDVVNLIKLSKATYQKMLQNLAWASGYNLIAMPLAAGVFYKQGIIISPALGAVLMSLSTVIVAANAKLLRID